MAALPLLYRCIVGEMVSLLYVQRSVRACQVFILCRVLVSLFHNLFTPALFYCSFSVSQ